MVRAVILPFIMINRRIKALTIMINGRITALTAARDKIISNNFI